MVSRPITCCSKRSKMWLHRISLTLCWRKRRVKVHQWLQQTKCESMTYGDNAFDYVMCKQAFHHFPKSVSGSYEMIRVSKMAAILVAEPIDILSKMASLMVIKNVLTELTRCWLISSGKSFFFRTVGNYVFKVSGERWRKLRWVLASPFIAFKRLNIFATHETIEGLGTFH